MSKAYKGMTKIVAADMGDPYVYMENPYAGTIGAAGETWAEQIIYVVDAVETAVERHFEAENKRLRAALGEIAAYTAEPKLYDHEDDMSDRLDAIYKVIKEALGDE